MDIVNNKRDLPNSTGTIILGIASIPTCACFAGVLGIVLGIIGLVLGNKDKKLYEQNPANWTEKSYKNMNAGRICAIVGICISSLYLVVSLIFYSVLFSTPEFQEILDEILREFR